MPLRLRRSIEEPRLEIMPLIDVVFLLLTFFIYAMVLMIRARVLPVSLPTLSASSAAVDVEAVSVTIDGTGSIYVDAEPIELDGVVAAINQIRAQHPDARVYLAPAIVGEADRLPVFLDVINALRGAGVQEFYIVGTPGEPNETGADQ